MKDVGKGMNWIETGKDGEEGEENKEKSHGRRKSVPPNDELIL